ncbi:murein L,D-transpeptidase catalytic domain family protein [uncultured Hymenobacter sp.]|uniref:murein L,D-transpeptidase catalytic domain family protein n=1 Tax=uncultured Hymenobacter sp. TaxID=170016 RepID=UPI0035CA514C
MLQRFRFLGIGLALAVCASGCQLAEGNPQTALAAARSGAEALATTPLAATATEPDSLRLTPLLPLPAVPDSLRQAVQMLYAGLGPAAADLRLEVLERACVGYLTLRHAGRIKHPSVLAVADMDLPSFKQRLWVLDLEAVRVLHRSHVAHGRGSGHRRAYRFSNTMKSACTSLGFYRTEDTYGGKHGLSRRLHGLDAGQNSNAESRYVVLHAADYVSAAYLREHGQAGYSRGCPALPPDQYRAIIKSLPQGSCLFLSGPSMESRWLDGAVAAQQLAAHGWH